MSNAFYNVPVAINEPVKSYAPGSPEKIALIEKYQEMYNQEPIDVPM
jgi:1-pyrroline-5-carboxylate dehydrogenase